MDGVARASQRCPLALPPAPPTKGSAGRMPRAKAKAPARENAERRAQEPSRHWPGLSLLLGVLQELSQG